MKDRRSILTWINKQPALGAPKSDHWLVDPGDAAISILVQAGSHVEEAIPLQQCLQSQGQGARIIVPMAPTGWVGSLRSSSLRWQELNVKLAEMGNAPSLRTIPSRELLKGVTTLIVFNDWGFGAPLISEARSRGIRVIGWVEGFQDFMNQDLERAERPYRKCDFVATVTADEVQLLSNVSSEHVGSQRLWDLRKRRFSIEGGALPLLINLNFSYGAQRGSEKQWVEEVVSAAELTHLGYAFSRHPAARQPPKKRYPSSGPSGLLVPRSEIVVSRSGTMILEAVACEKSVLFYNPFGERAADYLLQQFPSIMAAVDFNSLTDGLRRRQIVSATESAGLFQPLMPAKLLSEIVLNVK